MRKLVILINQFINPSTHFLQIGGVQTYIRDLACLAINNGYKVIVYQNDTKKVETCFEYEGISIISEYYSDNQKKFDSIYRMHSDQSTLFIIATDMMNVHSKKKNVISIQHGITFDIPGNMIPGFWRKTRITQSLNKLIRNYCNVRRFHSVKNTVCVDYNYYNWFRTLATIEPEKNVMVIPNYCSGCISEDDLDKKLSQEKMKKKIVFARRFEEHRGAVLFANVVNRLFDEGLSFDVTFAGDGTFKSYLEKTFIDNENVHFTKYSAEQSIAFHKNFDIAVVPTIFSEGTSLSLCEAMAAGVFPICTHVGGMTNIILDHYNGIMTSPNEEQLYLALKDVLLMKKDEYNRICRNAYSSATEAFCKKNWEKKWLKFMEDIVLRGAH